MPEINDVGTVSANPTLTLAPGNETWWSATITTDTTLTIKPRDYNGAYGQAVLYVRQGNAGGHKFSVRIEREEDDPGQTTQEQDQQLWKIPLQFPDLSVNTGPRQTTIIEVSRPSFNLATCSAPARQAVGA